jgi:hypothetical protein
VRPIFILVGFMTFACDPGFDVKVDVVDSTGNPLPGIAVQLACPPAGLLHYRHHMDFGTTDAKGHTAKSGIGEVKLDCWIHAAVPSSPRVDVRTVCAAPHPYLGLCSRLTATLKLAGAR